MSFSRPKSSSRHVKDTSVIAAGFGRSEHEAGHRARASLLEGFDAARQQYIGDWQTGRKDYCRSKAPSTMLRICIKSAPP